MKKFIHRLNIDSKPVRRPHLFSTTRPEVAIVNNSGLFFTLASCHEHTMEAHPELHVIMPEFWLDTTHKDFDDLDWGQTPLGLPWYVRNEFYKLFKDHSKHEYIRWGQIKELRQFVVSELKRLGSSVYTGIPEITELDNIYKIRTKEKTFSVNKNLNHFYNSFRVPAVDHGFEELEGELYKRSHTDIYRLSRDKTAEDSVIVLGTGRSVIWLAKHFPNVPIASIGYDHPSKSLFADETFPPNLFYYDKKKFTSEFELKGIDPNQGIAAISSVKNSNKQQNFIGKFFCAIGLQHIPNLTSMIPPDSLTLYPSAREVLASYGGWVSPGELPIGSLAEATSRWAITTNNMSWAYECYCYHPTQTIEYIANRFEEAGIDLNYKFFDKLNSPLLLEQKIPDDKRINQLYRQAYEDTYYDVTENKRNQIETTLARIDQERLSNKSTTEKFFDKKTASFKS